MDQNPPAPAEAPLPKLGELMSAATDILVNSPGVFLAIWAATGLPALALSVAAELETGIVDKATFKAAFEHGHFDRIGVLAAAGMVGLLLDQFGITATIIAASDGGSGRRPAAGAALSGALARFPAVLWTDVVVGVRVFLGLLFFIIPGIILTIRYSFSQFTATLDPYSGGPAAARSSALIVPNVGKVVGNMLVFALVVLVVGFTIGFVGGIIETLLRAAAGPVPALAVRAATEALISLVSAWNVSAMWGLYSAISARTPREA